MPRDWKPNAPDVKKAFDQAQKPARPSPAQRPASVIELHRLEAQRKKAAPHLTLEMRGPTGDMARRKIAQDNESEIARLRKAFAQQRGRARDGFNRAR